MKLEVRVVLIRRRAIYSKENCSASWMKSITNLMKARLVATVLCWRKCGNSTLKNISDARTSKFNFNFYFTICMSFLLLWRTVFSPLKYISCQRSLAIPTPSKVFIFKKKKILAWFNTFRLWKQSSFVWIITRVLDTCRTLNIVYLSLLFAKFRNGWRTRYLRSSFSSNVIECSSKVACLLLFCIAVIFKKNKVCSKSLFHMVYK